MPQELLMLRVNCSGCRAEAWVNDIPVTGVDASRSPLSSLPIHEYVLPKENHFLLLVEPGANPNDPKAGEAPFQAGPRTFATLEIFRGPRGVFPEHPAVQKLDSLQWRPQAGTQVSVPARQATTLTLNSDLPRWSWLKAEPLRISQEMNESVLTFVQAITASFGRGDPAPYLRAAETKFVELAEAYGLSAAEMRENFLSQWRRVSSKPGFRLAAISSDTLALRLCGSGRVIDCLDKELEPLVRAERLPSNGVTPIRYPMKLAQFGRELRIVR